MKTNDFRRFLEICLKPDDESNREKKNIEVIDMLCQLYSSTSLDGFMKDHRKWASSHGLDENQRIRCVCVNNLYRHAVIKVDEFGILVENFADKKKNWFSFLEYAINYDSDDEDHFVNLNDGSEMFAVKDRLDDFDWVKKQVLKLAFFDVSLKEGELILLTKTKEKNQRLAIYTGKLTLATFIFVLI